VKKSKIAVQEIIEEFDLALLAGNPENRYITISDIKRPGIELAGFWEFFTPDRVQLLGMTEISFLRNWIR
jgi:Serine kinase of the HPr protein, regulates carbohydrate metabolism